MTLTYIAAIVALFFAMNIGASGAAASISVAYGSGAIKTRKNALLVCGIAIFLGAVIGGREVAETIGSGIIPSDILNAQVVLIILSSAAISLFIANLLGIPLSTSEITVGSIVGVGIAQQALFIDNILVIASFWVIVPVVGFTMAFLLGKVITNVNRKYPQLKEKKAQKVLTIFVIIVGFLEAFSAGMNNVANAIGPLVGANLVSMSTGILLGGICIATGAMFLGGNVLQTNAKKITRFTLLEGVTISGTGSLLVIIASIFGLPVPLTQVTSTAIMGIGVAKKGKNTVNKQVISKIVKVWVVSPVFSLVISYGLMKLFVDKDIYTVIVLLSVSAATFGILSLVKTIQQDKRSYYENGEGI
ncbi:inorganic phosphate transporter [Niallia endozanthoxylica]|uniref:Inorganic phosphate transporter n=1 Tax=Niallia endozanthoxylica TaxID=2036016 RepID=A0A5J5HNI7_9BACI|nr:inorganic phosphate transporter [Niallia endozanthoxylica]KAA9021802.1 inorganic phosphate transporter [Niallia endozanthoxylica]